MKFYVKNRTYNGTRFFVLQPVENNSIGYGTVEECEADFVNIILTEDKILMVKSLQEYELESKFVGSIIKSEVRFLILGWN
jgi:hypothetical protein